MIFPRTQREEVKEARKAPQVSAPFVVAVLIMINDTFDRKEPSLSPPVN